MENGVTTLQSAFKCRIMSYRATSENHHINVVEFMSEIKPKILPLILSQIGKFSSVKVNLELFGFFILESKGLEDIKSFNTVNQIATVARDLDDLYDDFTGILDEKVSEFQERESGIDV